jgi:hypothetical protein
MSEVTDKHHIMLYRVHIACAVFELTTLVVIGTDCIGNINPTTIRPRHDIAEILLKVALNTITLANQIQLANECLWFKEFRSFWTSEIT